MIDVVITTILLASITTIILLMISLPLSYFLAFKKNIISDIISAIVALPIILPPTVIGYYLLIAIGAKSPIIHFLNIKPLAFTFKGLVIGSIVYSLPFAISPIKTAFETIGKSNIEAAQSLGASLFDAFFSVVIPQSIKGIISAAILVFAHTIGEFGVVMMIGGAIPNETEVLSIHIFQAVEQGNFYDANILSFGLLIFSFLIIFIMQRLGGLKNV